MKILFWTDGFWPRIGGIETQGFQLIEALQTRGHQCRVLAHKDHPHWDDDEIYNGITIKRFDFKALGTEELKNIRPLADYLKSIVEEFQVDLVHLNACAGWSAFAFLLFRSLFRMPIVFTIHAPFFYESLMVPPIEKIAASVDQIGCVSHWVLKEMEKKMPLNKDKLRLIYNGLKQPEVAPSPLPFSPPTLLLLGRLASEKGFDTALKAFSLLKTGGSNARLLIAGEGDFGPSLENLANELGLSDSCQFIGKLGRDQIPSLINQATLVIVPSYFETFGLVALEAMQLARPVIASRVGGLPELIIDQTTGLLVPPHDPLALSKALQDLLNQPEKAIKFGLEGQKRSQQQFTLDQNVTQYEDLYKELK